ncbi:MULTISPECIES: hypothetical protein [Proteiniphilum]|jgi:hypothetical protein|uniref:hypothetical protein n=1 Tax=Proteiniphilum TaxID=294702 RepID=UPI001EEC8957|nr:MULTISPECIES: hypothetical protein [Proteiniphilum]MDD2247626.1 hypothetical protein [Proteiniphilum sp.]ULB34467.1 hypothetical protein KDN43_16230 [Proteiniphilum propionicum]
MKKITLFVFLLLISTSLFAQRIYRSTDFNTSSDIPLNEVKINLPFTIFATYPEISYERILNSDISVGATLGVGLDTDRYPYDYAFTPHFRWFFGGNTESMQKYAAGFFIEANGSVYSQVMENGSDFGGSEVSKLGSGLGLAVGWKYVTLNNWVGEIYLGGGRNFIKNDYDEVAYPRFGISIGKRF